MQPDDNHFTDHVVNLLQAIFPQFLTKDDVEWFDASLEDASRVVTPMQK